MRIPNEITTLIQLINKDLIWLYIIVFVVLAYLIISLLTWSFIKPLKYLGIPTTIVGLLFLSFRMLSGLLVSSLGKDIDFIKIILPNVVEPILLEGIFCIVVGILMILIYSIINKQLKKVINQ